MLAGRTDTLPRCAGECTELRTGNVTSCWSAFIGLGRASPFAPGIPKYTNSRACEDAKGQREDRIADVRVRILSREV
jgi:hypothetical protein